MEKNNNKRKGNPKRRINKGKKFRPNNKIDNKNTYHTPKLTIDVHAPITQNLTGVNLKQINIIPSLSVFP